jgi:hypothetical protein
MSVAEERYRGDEYREPKKDHGMQSGVERSGGCFVCLEMLVAGEVQKLPVRRHFVSSPQ